MAKHYWTNAALSHKIPNPLNAKAPNVKKALNKFW